MSASMQTVHMQQGDLSFEVAGYTVWACGSTCQHEMAMQSHFTRPSCNGCGLLNVGCLLSILLRVIQVAFHYSCCAVYAGMQPAVMRLDVAYQSVSSPLSFHIQEMPKLHPFHPCCFVYQQDNSAGMLKLHLFHPCCFVFAGMQQDNGAAEGMADHQTAHLQEREEDDLQRHMTAALTHVPADTAVVPAVVLHHVDLLQQVPPLLAGHKPGH